MYLLRSKDEAFEAFKCYKLEVENKRERKIKILRSNGVDKMNSMSKNTLVLRDLPLGFEPIKCK